jgi:MinD-like ATPase involved in chromosome partitioning or flagellar assembly
VIASVDDFGAGDILSDSSVLRVRIDNYFVHLLDRRLVGADWLRLPGPLAPPPPRFVFASFKGGVGRSTALAVAAAHFAAQGRRVLAIDLDMEAPGLGAMLLDENTVPEFGLIDALVENGLSPLDESFFVDMVGPSALADRNGRIDVIPAFGGRSIRNPGDILAKISRAYTEDIRPNGAVATILDQVLSVVNHFADPKRYDAILIDARAGLHETSASAILGLGAEVFLFGMNERQTFQGYAALFAHLARFIDPNVPSPEWLGRLTMIHAKASRDAQDRASFAEKCVKLFLESGLLPSLNLSSDRVPLPAAPFGNVPWDDSVRDEDLDFAVERELNEPVPILDDERFRLFDPSRRSDILSEKVYQSSFRALLVKMNEAFPDEK